MDKIKIKDIRNKLKGTRSFIHEFRRLKWNWAGHVSRMQDNRWAYRITNWYIGDKRWRQKRKWADEIAEFISNKNWGSVARDRHEWPRLSEAYAQNLAL